MCGIAGIVSRDGLDPEANVLLHKMCDRMVHRGPDDAGFHFSERAALGIRRLSIIDLKTGHQPLFNEDGSMAVILNGEIYNYRELRRSLESKGHRFSTASDTETIVHLYEEYGEEGVRQLRGMFCFALWDERRQRLLVARDRIGIKQLYYLENGGRLLFASEIKCLLEDPRFAARIHAPALAAYLSFLYVPAPATMFSGISELPPAHYLIWERGQIRTQRYWQLEYHVENGHPESYYAEGLLAKLTDSVKCHLVSDVPLGAFLSGGIDSGSVVALMSKVTNQPVETFTIGFEGNYGFYDEREEARLVAERCRSQHHEFVVRPDLTVVLPRIVWALDQPLADSSAVPNYYVCQMARSRVTVALSAMGGDEMAGGYERYLAVLLGSHYRKLPQTLRRWIARAVGRLPDVGGRGRFSATRLKRFLNSADYDPVQAYFQLLSTFNTRELKQVLVGEWRAELDEFSPEEGVVEAFRRNPSQHLTNQMLFTDLTGYLPGDLLPLTDRMSMAHSLEVRVPFLDHELLEFAASIPPELKIHRLTKKHILRKAVSDLLPRQHFRKPKRGFSVPMAFWIRHELRAFVEHLLSPGRIAALGCFDPARVATILDEHFAARENHENKIWALMVFSLWHELYMNGGRAEGLIGALPQRSVSTERLQVR